MGEVFRARDERLGRDVALKLIRPASNENPDHLRRFELEARAAASLNHPNIVAIYDVGFDEGSPYIVCELLEGTTLRKRLKEGMLPVRLAADYALQIVRGLIAAHQRRIVHRDLKPENLFVTMDGRVKILDFGVAKLQTVSEEGERTVEELTTVTKVGAVIGTVAYMSPEQLRAKSVDHRSDIFSVGGILYEMLTGQRAFEGDTEVDTITAVLREDIPEINFEKAGVPISYQQIVRHCLEKEPESRFQSARDLAFALETLTEEQAGPPRRRALPRTRTLPWAIAAGVVLLAVVALLAVPWRQSTPAPTYRRLTFDQGTIYSARFAPDYRSIVYGAAWNGKPLQLFSTVADSLLAQPLNLDDTNLLSISRSGELAVALHGSHVAHLQTEGGTLARAPLAGGSPREVLNDVAWADWDPDGELAVAHHTEGRDRLEYPIGHAIYESDGWISHIRFSPQADKIAFINHPALWDDRGSLCVIDLAGRMNILTQEWESAMGVAWSPSGKEIWFTAVEQGGDQKLLAVGIGKKIRTILKVPGGLTLQDIAPDGRVLISTEAENLAMVTVARGGKPVDLSWHNWSIPKDISPDGQSILFEDASEVAGPEYAVAIRKIDGTPPVQLGEGSAGGLSPDGKWAISIITGGLGQLKLVPIGPGQHRTIPTPGLKLNNGKAHFLADGKRIAINASEPGHGVRCYLVDVEGGKKPVPITPEGIPGGLVSPDGQSILGKDHGVFGVYSVNGGAPHVIPHLEEGFSPLQWVDNGSALLGFIAAEIPAVVYKVNLATGQKTFIQELQPETTTAVVSIAPVISNRDGSRFAYSYYQLFSVLYLASGLR